MKYLIVLIVIAVAVWVWRNNRREEIKEARDARAARAAQAQAQARVAPPQAMVRCAHCGLHLPAADALPGPDATQFCSAAHRRAGPA